MHEDRSFNLHWQSHPDSPNDPVCSQITIMTELCGCQSLTHTPLKVTQCGHHNGKKLVTIFHVQVAAVPVFTADFVPCVCSSHCSPSCACKPCQTFRVQVKATNMKSPCRELRITNTYHNTANNKQIT